MAELLAGRADVELKSMGYLGVSVALGKEGAAGWLLGDRLRAELYSSRGDWKATWGGSRGGRGVSLPRKPTLT